MLMKSANPWADVIISNFFFFFKVPFCGVEFLQKHTKVKAKAKCLSVKHVDGVTLTRSHLTETDLVIHPRIVNPGERVQPLGVAAWSKAPEYELCLNNVPHRNEGEKHTGFH